MSYEDLLAKIKKGEAFTAEDITEFEKETRPTARFNEVSNKAREAQAQLKAKEDELAKLQAEASTAKQTMEDQIKEQLSALSGKVETLSTEKEQLAKERADLDYKLKVVGIATKNKAGAIIKNPDYLAYRLKNDGVDIAAADKVDAYIENLKNNEPELFMVAVKSGAGTGQPPNTSQMQTAKHTSLWSDKEKVEYIKTNGEAAYMKLVAEQPPLQK